MVGATTILFVTDPCDPRTSKEARELLAFLGNIAGKGVLLGQHTQTRNPKELAYIREVTGKQPALCGFELLAYSGNINWDTCDEACLKELYENLGTLENALAWGRAGGIVTLTWHWYSPVGGRDKSFYSNNTDFDAEAALREGTGEHRAMCRDLDLMAVHLRRFAQEHIPVLWRPFHEADGNWFWWGVRGPEIAKRLYRFMHDYFTRVHGLHHLIWVWNSPKAEGYPGDDVVDVISRDMYPPQHEHTACAAQYRELTGITPLRRLCVIGEIGSQPSVAAIAEEDIPWCWYMTWSGDFGASERFTDNAQLIANYTDPHAITLENLPQWKQKAGGAA